MPFVTDWSSSTGEILLHFSASTIAVFQAHQQTVGRPEAGGILLGTVHEHGLLITHATAPSRFDKQFLTIFFRSAHGHRAVAQRLWRASGGTTRYLGDWHTHPEDSPSPSSIDLREWRKLAFSRNDGRPALSVIVGRFTLHVELMHSNGHRDQLLPAN